MFNKYVDASTVIQSPKTIEHREFRAPTDDSIRLAKEYEDKITSKIVGQVVFGENDLEFPKGQALYVRRNPRSLTDETYICFKLNGKLYEKELVMHRSDWIACNNSDKLEVLKVFAKKVSEAITEMMVHQALNRGDLSDLIGVY